MINLINRSRFQSVMDGFKPRQEVIRFLNRLCYDYMGHNKEPALLLLNGDGEGITFCEVRGRIVQQSPDARDLYRQVELLYDATRHCTSASELRKVF